MRLREYPKYKPSGVEWMEAIPAHWNMERLKHIATVQFSNVDKHAMQGEEPTRLCNYVDVYHNDFITNGLNFMEATATRAEIAKFALRKDDVLITKDSEEWDDIAVPAHVSSDLQGVLCGYHLAQIRPNPDQIDGKYLFRSFCSRGINDQFRVAATGITRYGLGKYWLDNGLFLVPPLDEQRAIAAFLDRETARIDALIEKKQRQIELLQEKRAALISHAVTNGLNPNVKMKDSGIEWLGKIPERWETIRLKYVSSINDEVLSEATDPDYELLYVDISSVHASSGVQKKEPMRFENAPSRARRKVQHGDVIVSTVRTYLRAIAPISHPEDNLIVSTGFAVVRPRKTLDNGFAAYALRATYFVDAVVAQSVGVSYPATNASEIGEIYIVLPPLPEQSAVAGYLAPLLRHIDQLIEKVCASIEDLREYRTALTSAAVTGKIDLRNAVSASKESRKAPLAFQRAVLAAEIVDRLHKDPSFGRVKFQKILYLCQHHLGMNLDGCFHRQAAGPYDNKMRHSIESQMERQRWYFACEDELRTLYVPMENAGGHRKYFSNYWLNHREGLISLIALLQPLDTARCEIVATLFAAWNDLIIARGSVSDDVILKEVRTNWHESKERFTEDRLKKALQWMREHGLVPQGRGKTTSLVVRHRSKEE